MAEIEQVQIADIIARLPQLVPWDSKRLSHRHISLLVTCAGFEDRATEIGKSVAGMSIENMIVIAYPTNAGDNEPANKSLGAIQSHRHIPITYNRSTFFMAMCRAIDDLEICDSFEVVVDISAMASYVTSKVLRAIWDRLENARLFIFYAEAKEYHPTLDAWTEFFQGVENPEDNLSIAARYEETYFQSRGVSETYECDVFPGRNPGPLATELVAIPSFSLQRVKSLTTFAESRYNVAPRSTHWFLGSPPDKAKNGWRFDAMAKLYNVQSGATAVDTRDYRDVFRKLDEVWNDGLKNERHLVVGALGSKMQTVGVFLFLMMHPECGLLHSEPTAFISDRYSTGVGPLWCLDFGRLHDVSTLLTSRSTLQFRW